MLGINFDGLFQLVRVTDTGKTKENGIPYVNFIAACKRSKDNTDFKLFKMLGKNAEIFLENLEKEKDKDGKEKYKSRRIAARGYIETYKKEIEVTCKAELTPEEFPSEYGKIKKPCKVLLGESVFVDCDILIITQFTFIDSNGVSKGKKKKKDTTVRIEDVSNKEDKEPKDEEYEEDEVEFEEETLSSITEYRYDETAATNKLSNNTYNTSNSIKSLFDSLNTPSGITTLKGQI